MKHSRIGNLIKEARKEAGLTQLQLADKCCLDIRTIQRIESGKVYPRLYTLNLINEVLGTKFKLSFEKLKKPKTKFDKLNWKKNILSAQYDITSDDKPIGSLFNNTFSQSGVGTLNGKKYTFKTVGFLNQYSLIYNQQNEQIGSIEYNTWMTKAKLTFANNEFYWRYNNWMYSKWSISNSDGVLIKYFSSTKKGTIESNVEDEILLLSGLFITNYFKQLIIAIMVAAFVPIWSLLLR